MTRLHSSLCKLPLCALNTGVNQTAAIHQAGVIAVSVFDVAPPLLLLPLYLSKMICRAACRIVSPAGC